MCSECVALNALERDVFPAVPVGIKLLMALFLANKKASVRDAGFSFCRIRVTGY